MKWYFCIAIVILSACQYSNKEPLAARVGNHYLTVAELMEQIPDGLEPEDSITLAENFVDRWIKNKLNLAEAEEMLERSDLDVRDLLEDYRESLILHYFEEKVAKELVDSVVSNATISEYYDANKHEFILEDDLHSVWIIKSVELSKSEIRELKEDISEAKNTIEISLPDSSQIEERWFTSEDLERLFDIHDISSTFADESKVELIKSPNQFVFIKYRKKKEKGDIAPLDFVRNKIIEIVLEERKIEAISEVKNQIYREALQNNRFKKYKHD